MKPIAHQFTYPVALGHRALQFVGGDPGLADVFNKNVSATVKSYPTSTRIAGLVGNSLTGR